MQGGDDLRAVPNGSCDPLDRARPHIANGENAPSARLQRLAVLSCVRAGQHETRGVEGHAGVQQPIGVRIGSDEEKQVTNSFSHFAWAASPDNVLKDAIAPFQPAKLGVCHDLDVVEGSNPLDEVTRHACRKAWPTHQNPDLGG